MPATANYQLYALRLCAARVHSRVTPLNPQPHLHDLLEEQDLDLIRPERLQPRLQLQRVQPSSQQAGRQRCGARRVVPVNGGGTRLSETVRIEAVYPADCEQKSTSTRLAIPSSCRFYPRSQYRSSNCCIAVTSAKPKKLLGVDDNLY